MLEITKTKSQPDESQLICNAFSSCAPASIQISRKNQVGCQKGPKRGKEKVSRNEICDWIHYKSQKKMKKEIMNNNTDNDDGDGDFNDKICRYIVHIIYRSRCLMQRNKQQDWLGI